MIDRMPRELWAEVHDIQEAVIKTIPRKRNAKGQNGYLRRPSKQLRKEDKLKIGEKARYTDLNAEFQRTARRYRKGFLSDHCKEIEENSRM